MNLQLTTDTLRAEGPLVAGTRNENALRRSAVIFTKERQPCRNLTISRSLKS